VDIELQFVEGCPHVPVIRQRLADALEAVGRGDIEVWLTTIRTADEARKFGFTGSPTVLIDGRDPFARPHTKAALSCRLYSNAPGSSGLPSIERLIAALLGWEQPGSRQ
jgi:hypothetical protein